LSSKTTLYIYVLGFFALQACNRLPYTSVQQGGLQQLDSNWTETHQKIDALIQPYKNQIGSQMNVVIGYSAFEMIKARPESALGNGVCDMLMQYGLSEIDESLDLCIMNHGGLRAPIPKGAVTIGRIFELMPFDNTLVIVELDSTELNALASHILVKGGEPIAGVTHTSIVNYKSGACFMAGEQAFTNNKTYKILTSNYLADGGDGYNVFVGKPRTETNILIRQALLEGFSNTTETAPFSSQVDGRIIWDPNLDE